MTSHKPLISKDVLEFGFCRLDGLHEFYRQDIKLMGSDVDAGRALRGAISELPKDIKECFSRFLKQKISDRRFVAMCLLITLEQITKKLKPYCEIDNEGLTTRQIASIFGDEEDKTDLYTTSALYDFFNSDRKERKIGNRYIDKDTKRAVFAIVKTTSIGFIWKIVHTNSDEFFKIDINSVVIVSSYENPLTIIDQIPKLADLIKLHNPDLSFIRQRDIQSIDVLFITGTEILHSRYLVDVEGPPVEIYWGVKMTKAKFEV